ncbi:MAG: 5-formyltetrahydrofolate cyclo-ligase [Deltaproteobacteria bacterium RBG_16_64_85]|nr:MAG: 5-formyltetrahydrofolate cyclo-ligase [Deltaproteobacteria bacterium RBG_16_64_85]
MLMAERKAQLRRTERNRRRLCGQKETFAGKSIAAQEKFLAAFPPESGGKAALYAAVGGEVGTERIRARYLTAGALLFYPRVMEDGNLSFFPDGGDDGWVRGKYGLLEPRVPPGVAGLRNGFDLVVVPGVAFDAMGRRLGKGYGYYDRFLSGLSKTAVTVGLAFSRQLLPEVPVESWDIPVDVVVTEDGIIGLSREHLDGHTK